MNKKAFTLVELLAVIAILALLVIIAIPNVMSMFKDSKKKSFENEVKNIYKTAEEQWLSDSMYSSSEISYSRCDDATCTNPLKLLGRENLQYYIKLSKDGKVINYIANDGEFQYLYSGDGLNISEIENVQELSSSEDAIVITGSGVANIAEFVTRQNASSITPGDELIIGGDNFYVVSSDWRETVILSKYDLNSNYMQEKNGSEIIKTSFSQRGYWDGCNYNIGGCTTSSQGVISPYSDGGKSYCENENDTNCVYAYDSNSDLYIPVNTYVNKIASSSGAIIKGRLLSLEEAYNLKNANNYGLEAIKDKNGYRYFLGSTNTYAVWYINTSASLAFMPFYPTSGIRPVLVLSTGVL